MVNVIFGDNLNPRRNAIVPASTTISEFCKEQNFDKGTRTLTLNGEYLDDDDLDMSFEELGYTESVSLLAMARKNNA